jgi:hypothetical protein
MKLFKSHHLGLIITLTMAMSVIMATDVMFFIKVIYLMLTTATITFVFEHIAEKKEYRLNTIKEIKNFRVRK